MADRIFFLPQATGGVPPGMVEDLLTVAEIPEEILDTIAAKLKCDEGFLGPDQLPNSQGIPWPRRSCGCRNCGS